jgi:magnesium transporter
MAYVSELIGKPVSDLSGETIGSLEDIVASIRKDFPHPLVVAIVVKGTRQKWIIPYSDIAVLIAPAIPLNKQISDVTPFEPGENDLYLSRDVLDKQIIDTNGFRVVRVNDIELARVNSDIYVANVDIGNLGLLRRMGMAKMAQNFVSRLRGNVPESVISWDHVELIHPDEPIRLKVPGEKITELHPADLAEIISDLNRTQSGQFIESLDVDTLADTLEEVETEFQATLVENLSDEKLADVLEEMSPDAAADLLAELPKDRSEDLLELMQDEDAEDVRMLLAFPEDSAGGIMTTEYVSVGPFLTAEQAINVLRETASEAETIFYVFVVDEEDHLIGVFSLSDLIIAKPETPVTDFMHKRVVSVLLTDSQDHVAQMIAKYNLLAIPVVDDDKRIQGIVTSDDALDKIIPTAWKKRIPRLYH